jgi:hypothetical protein
MKKQLPSLRFRYIVRRLLPGAEWIEGNGGYASLADCPVPSYKRGPCTTVMLFPTYEEALKAKATIDQGGCGGNPCRSDRHRIIDLSEMLKILAAAIADGLTERTAWQELRRWVRRADGDRMFLASRGAER